MASSLQNTIRQKFGLQSVDDTYMKKIDLSTKDGAKYLDENQKYFVKKVEKANLVRYAQSQKTKKRGGYIGLFLFFSVIGLYAGTIHSIKQEKFLDEFENPEQS
ncbi:cytochrome c oxidase assembly factor 3, mitochondrial-like [Mizuhopecten yessoensis]|uniref:cytochrome c oxidase assembly factor 3, mitochondrial-like n=1 Tax=Mizuhopecten yessoensis TaxID=6573 RepID=UPI000B4585BC|nr:cytochrome c oxidase assembly factor 3, mitochondrial-like [Mizuhopecten yessoensis]